MDKGTGMIVGATYEEMKKENEKKEEKEVDKKEKKEYT